MLIQYKDKPERWNNDRKVFYAWREKEGFDLSGSTLCHKLHITSPVLCKYLGKFDFVRMPVPGSGKLKKQVVHFRSKEVLPYLQESVRCSRRMSMHIMPEDIYKKVSDSLYRIIETKDGPVSKKLSDHAIMSMYRDYGYNERIAWLFTETGLQQCCREWYKIAPVPCDTPIDWLSGNIERTTGTQNREMNQRRWSSLAAINVNLMSTTSSQSLVLHYLEDCPDRGFAVPAAYSDNDLMQESLPYITPNGTLTANENEGWRPRLPPDRG